MPTRPSSRHLGRGGGTKGTPQMSTLERRAQPRSSAQPRRRAQRPPSLTDTDIALTEHAPSAPPAPKHPHHDSSDPRAPAYSEASAPAPLLRPLPQPRPAPTSTAFSFHYKPAAIAQPPGATGEHRPGALHAGSCSSIAVRPPRSRPGNEADWDYSSQEPLRREGR